MPPPEHDADPSPPTPERPVRPAERARTTPPRAGRQRPEPTSSLAPSPAPLMSVPDPDPAGTEPAATGRSGRRQHRRAGAAAGAPTEELVYLSGRVPRALRDELHIRAIGEGRPVVDLLRDAIRGYLEHPAPVTRGR
jgi:hypothetical protein